MARAALQPTGDPPARVSRRPLVLVLRIVGPLLFVALLIWLVDPGDVWRTMRDADPAWLIACVVAFQGVTLLRVARWAVLHGAFGLPPASWLYHARLGYATALAALIVPQFISPFARFAMLAQDGYPRLRSAAASLAEKAGELIAYVVAGALGGLFLIAVLGQWWIAAVVLVGAAMACGVGWTARGLLRAPAGRVVDTARRLLGEETAAEAEAFVRHGHRAELLAAGALSLAVAAAQAIASYFAVRAVGIDLSFAFVVAAWGVVALTMLLPLSVNGIGTREGVYVGLFAARDVSAEAAFAASLVVVAAALVAAAPGALEWLYRFTLPRRHAPANDIAAVDAAPRTT
jgi:uncharacterized membrane protein YbhN (UPF0104 family)